MSDFQPNPVGSEQASHWYTKWYVWLVVVIVFGAVVVGGAYYVKHADKQDDKARVENASKLVNEAAEEGDYESAYRALKETEQQTQDEAQKVRLYGELAAAASNAGNIGEALEYYNKRHELDPSTKKPDAYLVGTLHERLEDIPKAIEYYRLSVEYYKSLPQNQQVRADLSGLESHLQELEKQ